jgi:hypothetical protein
MASAHELGPYGGLFDERKKTEGRKYHDNVPLTLNKIGTFSY